MGYVRSTCNFSRLRMCPVKLTFLDEWLYGTKLHVSRANPKIVVKGFHRLDGEGRARTMKIPQEFLLFRVDRNHRITSRLVLAPQTRNVLKLRVAVGMVAHGRMALS